MIEVEKKFILEETSKRLLTADAELLGTREFTDVYYDSADYVLTQADVWLRQRDGQWQLKIPVAHFKGRLVDQYEEIEGEEDIRKRAGIDFAAYKPFAMIKTVRTKYKKNGFIIDIDAIDYGYNLAEIELMVNSKAEVDPAIEKILAFAKEHGLKTAPVRGKVIEYLHRKDPLHFKTLEKAWGVEL